MKSKPVSQFPAVHTKLISATILLAALLSGPQAAWAENDPKDGATRPENSSDEARNRDASAAEKSRSASPNRGFAPSVEVSPDQEVDFPADI